jgi:hypothetical protein
VEIIETYARNYKLFCKDCGEIRILTKEAYKNGYKHTCKPSEAFNTTIKNMKDGESIEVDLSQEINGTRMDIIHIEPSDLTGMYLDNYSSEIEPIDVGEPIEKVETEIIKKPKGRPKNSKNTNK